MLSFFFFWKSRCLHLKNVRILSTSSPKKSIRYGNLEKKKKTYRTTDYHGTGVSSRFCTHNLHNLEAIATQYFHYPGSSYPKSPPQALSGFYPPILSGKRPFWPMHQDISLHAKPFFTFLQATQHFCNEVFHSQQQPLFCPYFITQNEEGKGRRHRPKLNKNANKGAAAICCNGGFYRITKFSQFVPVVACKRGMQFVCSRRFRCWAAPALPNPSFQWVRGIEL